MNNLKVVSSPLGAHYKLSRDLCPQFKQEQEQMIGIPYTNGMSSVIYVMVYCEYISRFMDNPKRIWGSVVILEGSLQYASQVWEEH